MQILSKADPGLKKKYFKARFKIRIYITYVTGRLQSNKTANMMWV